MALSVASRALVARASASETGYELTAVGPTPSSDTKVRAAAGLSSTNPPGRVLEAVLKAAKVPVQIDASRSLAADKVPYLAQANETDLAFVSRVAARAGLVVYEHDSTGGHRRHR